MKQNPTARKNGSVMQEMPDEILIYDLDTNKAHCLNETSALVWKACNGTALIQSKRSTIYAASRRAQRFLKS